MDENLVKAPTTIAREWAREGHPRVLIESRLWAEASAGVRSTENPATGEQLAAIPECGQEEASRALTAAARSHALGPWHRLSGRGRAELLLRLHDRVAADGEVLAAILTLDAGKPLREARLEVEASLAVLRQGAAEATLGVGTTTAGAVRVEAMPRPVGTVVVLGGSGLPLLSLASHLAFALADGNSVILKPTELAPLAALRLAEQIAATGFPDGVAQVLSGAGGTLGQALAADPRADLVALSGTVDTVRAVRAAIGPERRGPVTETLGIGTSLVLRDADLDAAADRVVLAACLGQGALPTSAHRVIVEEKVHDRLMLRIVDRLSSMVVGDGTEPETELGPLISRAHRAHVGGLLSRARAQGATLVVGGETPKGAAFERGHYIAPALLLQCTPEMEIWRTPPIAPVIAAMSVPDGDAAIAAANLGASGLQLGFTGTGEGERLLRDGLESRQIYINHSGFAPLETHLARTPASEFSEVRRLVIAETLSPSGWYRGN